MTLDPVSGEVVELEPFNAVMSKRSAQIRRNLDRLEAEWQAAHPGEVLGPVMTARLQGIAWTHQRPGKKPADLKNEQWWRQELADAGYDPATLEHRAVRPVVSVDDLAVQEVASRALDRCAASSSAWTRHTIQEQVTRITTEAGVHATAAELREFIALATGLAVSDCFTILPPGSAMPEHVAHLTSLTVIAAETALRDQLTATVPAARRSRGGTRRRTRGWPAGGRRRCCFERSVSDRGRSGGRGQDHHARRRHQGRCRAGADVSGGCADSQCGAGRARRTWRARNQCCGARARARLAMERRWGLDMSQPRRSRSRVGAHLHRPTHRRAPARW